MLSVREALDTILEQVQPFPPSPIPLAEALGLVLAEDVVSDQDSPPFDKSLMDGFALRTADVTQDPSTLRVVEEVMAGAVPRRTLNLGEATQIMTGAPIPEGADAVVRVEDTELHETPEGPTTVTVRSGPIRPGANIQRQGTSMKRGDLVLSAGHRLRPPELGILAELGRPTIAVRRRPRVAVLATGDELVLVSESPGPGEIRNSNETMLAAQIELAGGVPVPLGIARDEPAHLQERILAGLQCDMLLLSGGVSMGKRDLVPSELEKAGVRRMLHRVRVKPGKPVWFGVLDGSHAALAQDEPATGSVGDDSVSRQRTGRRYVFGLPGNPVSSMVCFELFVRPVLSRLLGVRQPKPAAIRARLLVEHKVHSRRPMYHPARLDWLESGPAVTPIVWQGSSDLKATVEANAMVLLPEGEKTYESGDILDVFVWSF